MRAACSAIPRSDKKDGIIIGFYRGAEIERERERRERERKKRREKRERKKDRTYFNPSTDRGVISDPN